MIAYFDCFSGISGDMILGAMVDAGVSPDKLRRELSRLPVKGYEIKVRKVKRAGMRATKVDVIIQDSGFKIQNSRKWKDIKTIIGKSTLSQDIKKKGLAIFKRLFEAEAKVHGSRYDRVHLHELGAVDCIVDIFGALICLDMKDTNTIYSSPINLGSGTIQSDHGLLPVPSPAAAELLKNRPVYSSDIPFELTTPTGAVLISSLADEFCPLPEMNISMIGTGAGYKNFKNQPNILRVFIGHNNEKKDKSPEETFTKEDSITVVETNIDDMNPQIYEYVMEMLFNAGALDVFLTQTIMKKGRPGIKLTVLCSNNKRDSLIDIIHGETTGIGVRFYRVRRKILQREIRSVKTKFGRVNMKIIRTGKNSQKKSIEYEDCKKIARKYKIPLQDVIRTVT